MIWRNIKKLFKESFCGFLYYRAKRLTPVRLFFDFDYVGELWNKSFSKRISQKGAEKALPFSPIKGKRMTQNLFAFLLSLNLYMGVEGHPRMIFVQGLLTAYFLLTTKEENFKIAVFYQGILTALLVPFLSLSQGAYILYVETGIILFFIVKYCEDFVYEKVVLYLCVMWLISGAGYGKSAPLTIAFMPYAIMVLGKGKMKKYIYGTLFLTIGFYSLHSGGYPALVGGAISLLVMIILGEVWLLIPSLLTVPWVISFGARFIKEEILSRNIVRTGLFFWRYGFRGAEIDYGAINSQGVYENIILIIYGAVFYLFFWYVLRISRRGVGKILRGEGKRAGILRAGTGAVMGFSVYTFFSGGHNLPYIVILYLVSGALLKRACP